MRGEPASLAERPSDDCWSTLEYACHVRDVYRLANVRVGLMLADENPTFENWDQDATAVEEHYEQQDPAQVAAEISDAAGELGRLYSSLPSRAAMRPGTRSDGARFTVEASVATSSTIRFTTWPTFESPEIQPVEPCVARLGPACCSVRRSWPSAHRAVPGLPSRRATRDRSDLAPDLRRRSPVGAVRLAAGERSGVPPPRAGRSGLLGRHPVRGRPIGQPPASGCSALTSAGVMVAEPDEVSLAGQRQMMLFMDPPQHERFRRS